MRNYYVIDRFEEEVAIIENMERRMYPIHVGLLPSGAEVGDVIELHILVDKEKTKEIEQEMQALIEDIFTP